MKNVVFRMIALAFLIAAGNFQNTYSQSPASEQQIKELKLKITGLTCAGCANHLHQVLSEIEGVKDNSVEYPGDIAVVEYDPKEVSQEEIIKIIEEKTNYKAALHS